MFEVGLLLTVLCGTAGSYVKRLEIQRNEAMNGVFTGQVTKMQCPKTTASIFTITENSSFKGR